MTGFEYYLLIFSTFIWALVPVRQFGGKYFAYFLAWVSADVLTLIARLVFHSGTNIFFAPLSFLALIALLDINFIKKHAVIFAVLFVLTCLAFLKIQIMIISVSIIHSLILIMFLKEIIISFTNDNRFTISQVILIFYEITVVAKFINYLAGFTNDYYYFIITTVFEIIFGLFFIIFKADDRRLLLQFK